MANHTMSLKCSNIQTHQDLLDNGRTMAYISTNSKKMFNTSNPHQDNGRTMANTNQTFKCLTHAILIRICWTYFNIKMFNTSGQW